MTRKSPDPAEESPLYSKKRARALRILSWSAPPILLASVLAGVAIVKSGPIVILGAVLGVLFAAPLLWVLFSTLWPAEADRSCPACGRDALERLDPSSTQGVICRECGWRDDFRSSWLLAEEEGPLEGIVLTQRRRRKGRTKSGVDRSAVTD